MPKTLRANTSDQRTLHELLAAFKITRWDLLLVGDGSGTLATKPGGWATVAVARDNLWDRRLYWGAANRASSNFCELMAYVAPLNDYVNEHGRSRARMDGTLPFRHVHILTDSEYCAKSGNGTAHGSKHAFLLGGYRSLKREGILLTWHWCGRDKVALNRFVDDLSRQARLLAEAYELEAGVEERRGAVHGHNPLD